MEEYIAVASKDGHLANPEESGTKLIMFSMENGQIVGVHDEETAAQDTRSLLKNLTLKGINRLYVSSVSPILHQALAGLGIIVKQEEDVAEDSFYNRFIFE